MSYFSFIDLEYCKSRKVLGLSVALVEMWYEEVKGYFTNSMAWVFKYPSPTDSLKEDIL